MNNRTRLLVTLTLLVSLTALSGVLIAVTQNVAAANAEETISSDITASTSGDPGTYAEGVIDIVLGDTIVVSGEGATVDGTTVNITAAGVYRISGTLLDGRIGVDAKGKVYLEFDGVNVASSSGSALTVTDAKKVTITLADETISTLTDASGDSDSDAALFTNDTLVINGSGTLVVIGNNNEGISSDDDIIINSGIIQITAVDDGLNAHDDITINGGEVYILAGGDGVDSNGTININGGTLISLGSSTGGDGGLDALGDLTITGGFVVAGGATLAAPCDESSQASLHVCTDSVQAAGTAILVTREGEEILGFALDKEFQSVLVSSSRLIVGSAYQVYLSPSDEVISATAGFVPALTGVMSWTGATDAFAEGAGASDALELPVEEQP